MPSLEISGLVKRFGDLRALNGVTFTVRPGEIFGFVGSNGAGKTTTMRIALGVLATDSGTVLWGGKPLDLEQRSHIGYMPEERGLYPRMKVGQQLEYMARLHGMDKAAAAAAARTWTEKLGIEARFDDEVQKLSLGNQQRVQLAAALVHDPVLLVLDEPFSGLDPVAVDVMSNVLRERVEAGVPVIFSSHQLDLVERLCDRVGIIKAGSMVADGTIEELRRTERPRWLVDGPDPATWVASVPTAVVLTTDTYDGGVRTVVEAPDGQAVLQAALGAGAVREFAPSRPNLTELFRHAVTEGSAS